MRLHESYKNDWSAFVSSFEKEFSSQKTAYYAQVDAQALTKGGTENLRDYALKFEQIFENFWSKKPAATHNLKCKKTITGGLLKRLQDSVHKRQVKHTSFVIETSIPFHTLGNVVDAEGVLNEKIRTFNLLPEIN